MSRLASENWNPKIELSNAAEKIKPILEDVIGMATHVKPSLKLLPYDEKSGNLGSHPIGTNEIIVYITNINGVVSLHIRKGVLAHELCHTIMNGVKAALWFCEGLAICLAIYAWEKLNEKNLANDFLYFVQYGSERRGLTKRLAIYEKWWTNVQSLVNIVGFENVKLLLHHGSEIQNLLLGCIRDVGAKYGITMEKWLINLIQKPTEEVKKSLERFLSSSHEERLIFSKNLNN